MNNKIISKFYLITGDGNPLYIGYTNRDIDVRFSEHLDSKDFSMYNEVISQEVDRLEFDFTWDITKVNKNAAMVSKRESELVDIYNTENSSYQLAKGGGNTWTIVKHLVSSKHSQELIESLTDVEAVSLIQKVEAERDRLVGIINRTKNPNQIRVNNLIAETSPGEYISQRNIISDTMPEMIHELKSTIRGTMEYESQYMHNLIINTKSDELRNLGIIIKQSNSSERTRLQGMVTNTHNNEYKRLSTAIRMTKDIEFKRLGSLVSMTNSTDYTRLKHLIGSTKDRNK